jgi:antitoxin component YwqK of YwqJK toxin-antitoxin module
MLKQFSLSFFCGIFLFSCSNSSTTSVSDSNRNDSGKVPVASAHTMTVDTSLGNSTIKQTDSVFNGEKIERYDNGVIFKRGVVAGGLRTGEWLSFFKDGKPWSKGTYVNGLRDGYGVSWFEDGKKSSEGYYKNGKPVGKWTYWDEYGTVKEVDLGGQ